MKTATFADVPVGTRLYNNDPRIPESDPRKVVIVTSFTPEAAGYNQNGRLYWIKLTRIHLDGKSRHQGYNKVV